MSFILDALKKSERERQRAAGPGMFAGKVLPPRARVPVWAIALGALLGVNLVFWVWWLMRTDVPTPKDEPPTAAASSNVPITAPQITIIQPAPVTNPAMPAAGDATESGSMGDSDIAAGVINPADFEPAVEAGEANNPAPPAATGPRPSVSGLPSREDLLLSGVRNIPEFSMSLHVYDPRLENRFAFINGQRALEGQTLANGARVEAIIPEGAILAWQGRRFLLALQN
jgi:hypothetical protein